MASMLSLASITLEWMSNSSSTCSCTPGHTHTGVIMHPLHHVFVAMISCDMICHL